MEATHTAGESRFTFGLIYDVKQAIERHGYISVDSVELLQSLFRLLHGAEA
ncbi:hypothetical protein AB0M34_04575 [Nocardia sp. NPDC050193]